MTDAICLGELLVDFVPTETGKDLIEASTFKRAAGGAPANVAVGLKRLGVSSGFMGKVGVDPFGRFLARTLEADGVDISALLHTRHAPTGLAFVSLRADGDRDFVFFGNPSADKDPRTRRHRPRRHRPRQAPAFRLHQPVAGTGAVGALTTMARGAIPSLPTRQRVDEFLETRKGL